jgi:hypothetical protein
MQYQKTIENLTRRAEHHARQSMLLQTALANLKPGTALVFQVHIQSTAPGIMPIMAEDMNLDDALEDAKALYREYNHRNPARFEVFARFGNFRVAIDPADLGPDFTLDTRVSGFPAQMVFADGDKLPSFHYANEPTSKDVLTPA